ncbi:hypothetical protein KEM55_000937 [Ascosphaera atra]|nr:hypothetical protein KEM55_000937 [Ascosphaera atra]
MSRIFLMKWYHFSVEYFEDLRNVNHCEFIVMKLNPATGKYVLQNKLRTWSGLGKEQERRRNNPEEADDDIIEDSAVTPWKMWCGCHPNDCEHIYRSWHAAPKRRNTPELFEDDDLPDTVRDLSIKQGGRGTGTITHNGCLVETAGTKGSSEQQPAQRKPEGGQEHDDTGDGRTGATTAADQEGPLVPSGSLDLSPMLPSFKISDMAEDDESSPSTTPRQSQKQAGGTAAAERKESRQEGDMSREEPPEADPAAGMHPPVHECRLPQHQEPPPLASPLPHRARRADLEEKIWRLGRDGGGSDSGVSSIEPSTTSGSEVSDRVEGCTHTDDDNKKSERKSA